MPPQPVVPTAIVGRAIDILRRHFAVLYPVALIFGLIQAMVTYALQDTNAAALGIAVTIVAGTLFQGMVVGFVRDVEAGLPPGTEPSTGALLRAAAPMVGPLVLVAILSAVGVTVGLIALIVPGLVLLTIWAVAAPVVVIERVGAVEAFGRSRALVRGYGWFVFGTLVLLYALLLPVVIVAVAVTGSGGGDVAGAFVQVLLGSLVSTVAALATATLYFRLRDAESATPPPAAPDEDAAAA